jgi:hypothetical protein
MKTKYANPRFGTTGCGSTPPRRQVESVMNNIIITSPQTVRAKHMFSLVIRRERQTWNKMMTES